MAVKAVTARPDEIRPGGRHDGLKASVAAGFTLIELLVVIAIMAILVLCSFAHRQQPCVAGDPVYEHNSSAY